jgi:hypothetical protein
MTAILIILGLIVAVGAVCYIHYRLTGGDTAENEAPSAEEVPAECCGQHAVCERDSLLMSVDSDSDYYDDEELDAFKGRTADSYDADEEERFREVMMTLRDDDVAPWARSIQRRGITLPTAVRDELIMMVSDIRASR